MNHVRGRAGRLVPTRLLLPPPLLGVLPSGTSTAARVVRVVDPVVLARTRSVDAWLRRLARATDEAGKAAGEAL